MAKTFRCYSTATSSGDPCQQPVSDPTKTCWREGHDKKTGRPRKELPDDAVEQIEKLAGYGLTQEEIGDFWGITDRTLRKRLTEDDALSSAYTRGRATYRADTHKRLRDIAFGKHEELGVPKEAVPVSEQRKTLVWIEKSQFGAAERHELTHAGADGGPIRVTEVIEAHPNDGDGDS